MQNGDFRGLDHRFSVWFDHLISDGFDHPVRESAGDSVWLLKAWNQHLKDAGIGSNKILATNKFTDDHVVFSHKLFDKLSSKLNDGLHDVAPNLLSTVRNVDEVFINATGKYSPKTNAHNFIKYFNDKPVAVLARMNEKENYLEAFVAFALPGYKSGKQMESLRRGILLVARK